MEWAYGKRPCGGEAVFAPRDIDEYLLPTERRVIRVRQHYLSLVAVVGFTLLTIL